MNEIHFLKLEAESYGNGTCNRFPSFKTEEIFSVYIEEGFNIVPMCGYTISTPANLVCLKELLLPSELLRSLHISCFPGYVFIYRRYILLALFEICCLDLPGILKAFLPFFPKIICSDLSTLGLTPRTFILRWNSHLPRNSNICWRYWDLSIPRLSQHFLYLFVISLWIYYLIPCSTSILVIFICNYNSFFP